MKTVATHDDEMNFEDIFDVEPVVLVVAGAGADCDVVMAVRKWAEGK